MVLNEEKRRRLVDVIARRQVALEGAGGSAPAVPLAVVQASPIPALTEKNKGVVAIDSDGDEDTGEGLVFKRLRVGVVAISLSATDGHPPSFRDNPPAPPLLAHSSCSNVVGRALLGMTKCRPLLSYPLFSSMPSRASKRRRQWRPWEETS